jgi:hypothetical protein
MYVEPEAPVSDNPDDGPSDAPIVLMEAESANDDDKDDNVMLDGNYSRTESYQVQDVAQREPLPYGTLDLSPVSHGNRDLLEMT